LVNMDVVLWFRVDRLVRVSGPVTITSSIVGTGFTKERLNRS
jgi:hypothetical protein